jgi:hypothetical protein
MAARRGGAIPGRQALGSLLSPRPSDGRGEGAPFAAWQKSERLEGLGGWHRHQQERGDGLSDGEVFTNRWAAMPSPGLPRRSLRRLGGEGQGEGGPISARLHSVADSPRPPFLGMPPCV